jgi:DNA-binding NarL/FixJ family response regulator
MSQTPFEPTHGFPYNCPLAAASGSNDQRVTAAKVKVGIVSGVRLVRESLTLSLRGRDGIVVVDAVGLDPEGIARITAAAPDVVLVDIGHTEPAAIVSLLKVSCSKAKLVAFALAETDYHVFACAAAGFSGYVPCEGGADELYGALIDAVSRTLADTRFGLSCQRRHAGRSGTQSAGSGPIRRKAVRVAASGRTRSCRDGLNGRCQHHPRGLLADHDRRRIGVARGQRRHDRGIGDAQPR